MPKPTKQKQSRAAAAVPRAASRRPGVGASAGTEPKAPKEQVGLKEDRAEELRFKVAATFKQTFKQAAKDLGLKKVALLETLFAEWQARRATSGNAAKPVAGKSRATTAKARSPRAAKPRSRSA